VVGNNNKDVAEKARRFLGTLGMPFAAVGADRDGRASIDWGAYGVPETFIVDGKGVIRYKLIGGLTADALAGPLNQQIEAAKKP
jgi:cytochrome c biogenesis protein CcmG/thiol:disulfide interchange protein DsbE